MADRLPGAYHVGVTRLRRTRPVVITDAPLSPAEEQYRRKRTYTVIMVVHIVGFALSGVLYYTAWWLGLAVLIVTTPLPWIAVVLANSPSRRAARAAGAPSTQRRTPPPALPRPPSPRDP